METSNKILAAFITLGILGILAAAKKQSKPYHSSCYSSYEEEQIDEMRADLNWAMDKLEKK